jgi:hypothetical protein
MWLSNNGPKWKIEEKQRILYARERKWIVKKERKKDVSSVQGLPESMARWNADWNGMPTVLLLLLFPVSGVYSVYIFSSCVYIHTQRTVLSLHTRCAYTRTDCFLRYNKRRAARSIVCVYTQCSPKRYQQVLEGLQSVYTLSLSTFPWSIFQVSLLKQNSGRSLSIPCEDIGDDGGGNWRPPLDWVYPHSTRNEESNQIQQVIKAK